MEPTKGALRPIGALLGADQGHNLVGAGQLRERRPATPCELLALAQRTYTSALPNLVKCWRICACQARRPYNPDIQDALCGLGWKEWRRAVLHHRGAWAWQGTFAAYTYRAFLCKRSVETTASQRDALPETYRKGGRIVPAVLALGDPGPDTDHGEGLDVPSGLDPARLAADRIDYSAWMRGLDRRRRAIYFALSQGERTANMADKLRVCPARISQLRREALASWQAFTA